MGYTVYILHSDSRDLFYVGSTGDVEQRVWQHNNASGGFTRTGRPWKLMYVEEYDQKSEALKRERYLKRMKSARYLKELIQGENKDPDA